MRVTFLDEELSSNASVLVSKFMDIVEREGKKEQNLLKKFGEASFAFECQKYKKTMYGKNVIAFAKYSFNVAKVPPKICYREARYIFDRLDKRLCDGLSATFKKDHDQAVTIAREDTLVLDGKRYTIEIKRPKDERFVESVNEVIVFLVAWKASD